MFTIDLTGQTAVLTGAGRGLTFDSARLMADSGANIVIGDLSKENAINAAKELEKLGVKGFGRVVDVTKEEQMKDLVDFAVKETGRLDIFVNGAGYAPPTKLFDTPTSEAKKTLDININGTDYGCKYAALAMREAGTKGRILNFASVAGRAGSPSLPHYRMTKAAIINLTQSYALTLAQDGITVNAVCPGIIRTRMWEDYLDFLVGDSENMPAKDATFDAVIERMIPMNKPQENIDIANAVMFLVSPQARYITGQSLNICGAMEMN